MENFQRDRRCLICRRVAVVNSSIHSEKLVSNASLLQNFLNCFHINVLDSKVSDLSTLCKFCPTCEQFIVEWSSIQTQMTQLTRRATQLKATLSALLLCTPEIHVQNHDDHVAGIINNRIVYSQENQCLLLLQKTVDGIRDVLQKKYSVRVVLDKITNKRSKQVHLKDHNYAVPLPEKDTSSCNVSTQYSDQVIFDNISFPPEVKLEPLPTDNNATVVEAWDHWECEANIQIPVVPKIEPFSLGENNDREPWDHSEFRADDFDDEEYLPSEDDVDDDETSKRIREMRNTAEEEANCDDSSVDSQDMNIKAGKSETNTDAQESPAQRNKTPYNIIPDGPNRFKYKGMSFQRNEEDETYTCDACGLRIRPELASISCHIHNHFTKKRKSECRSVVIRDGPNRFQFNGYPIRLNDQDHCYYCGVCNFISSSKLSAICRHIRETHYTAEDKVKFTAVQTGGSEWLYGGKFKILKVDENKFKCVSCGSTKKTLYEVVRHVRTHHVDLEGPDKVVDLPANGTPSVNVLTPIQGELESVPLTFNPADDKYTCGLCKTQVSTWERIRRHIRRNHLTLKVPCEICGVELGNQASYRRHIIQLHQTGPIKCPTCNEQLLGKRNFNNHMKLHELGAGAKKYECGSCDKWFLTLRSYKDHKRHHTGEKAYRCQICEDKFAYSHYLTRHRQTVHGIQPKSRRVMKVNAKIKDNI